MTRPSAVFFDINETLLDMGPLKRGLAEVLEADDALVDLWFANLLHHSLVDVATSQYHDFIQTGAATLQMVAHAKGIFVSRETALSTISKHITTLPAHSDVEPTLRWLQQNNVLIVALSNSSKAGLDAQLAYANIDHYFAHILSVESISSYKPHAKVYNWACERVGIENKKAMMVAAHGWDVSGAKAAGMQTTFVARPGKMMYPLGLSPDHHISTLGELKNEIAVKT